MNWVSARLFAAGGIFVFFACSSKGPPDGTVGHVAERIVAPTQVNSFALLATGRVALGDRTALGGGNIGVAPGTGDSVTEGSDAKIAIGNATLGQRIVLKDRTTTGDLFAGSLSPGSSVTYSSLSPYAAPPPQPAIPAFTAGGTPLNVNAPVSIPGGNYGAVTVNSTLTLTGGVYQFQSLSLNNNAIVQASGQSLVRVVGKVTGGNFVRLVTTGTLPASTLRLVVAGATDATGGVWLGTDARVTALVLSRAGFTAADRFTGKGSIAARDIAAGNDTTFTFQSGFECGADTACSDSNSCTVDSCVEGKCEHAAVADNTACASDSNDCTTDKCSAGVCGHTALPNGTACADDQNSCTSDSCSSGSCAHVARLDGTSCTDEGDLCTIDTCSSGLCSHSPIADCTMHVHPPTPINVPKPPAGMDCGWYTPRGWESIPCATSAEIDQYFPHLEFDPVAIQSNRFVGTDGTNVTLPLLAGELESTFTAVDTLTDVIAVTPPSPACPGSGTTTPKSTPNIWSVQANTNGFVSTAAASVGHSAGVQFAIQTGTRNGELINDVCVWNVDISSQDYTQKFCVIPPPHRRAGKLMPFDSSTIVAYAEPTDNTLHIIAKMSYVEAGQPYIYTVKSADVYGLINQWTRFDGDFYGAGSCSQATFTNTQLVTRLAASTCKNDLDATSSIAACPVPVFKPHASVLNGTATAESNNLMHVAPPIHPPDYPNDDLATTSFTASTTGMCLDAKHIYISDRVGDTGSIPSNQGKEAFWESPDLFLVTHNTPVDVNAVSFQSEITAGGTFDVYVRVHNDYGCSTMTGAKALIYLADPAALSAQWVTITGNQYAGDMNHPGGTDVLAGKSALIGPFTFTAPMNGFGDGHKCMIAAIVADGEAPPVNNFDAPNSNQVAQRNLEFTDACTYPVTNATSADGNVSFTLTATPPEQHPSLSSTPDLEVTFDDPTGNWASVWAVQPGNGTDFVVTSGGGTTKVRLGTNQVVLGGVPLRAGETRNAHSSLVLERDGAMTTLSIQATLGNGVVVNGMSCKASGPGNPT